MDRVVMLAVTCPGKPANATWGGDDWSETFFANRD